MAHKTIEETINFNVIPFSITVSSIVLIFIVEKIFRDFPNPKLKMPYIKYCIDEKRASWYTYNTDK